MKFDPASGFWIDAHGARFIRNEFNPNCPTYLLVSGTHWTGEHLQKACTLAWPSSLHPDLRNVLETVLRDRMRRMAPSAMVKYEQVIEAMDRLRVSDHQLRPEDLLDGKTVRRLWDSLHGDLRPYLRSLLPDLIASRDPHAAHAMSLLMQDWRAQRRLNWQRSVREWDPRDGSMTSAELETLRRHLSPPSAERPDEHFSRLIIRLTLTTLRRPSQIISIEADGLRRISTAVGSTADVQVPTGKAQTGTHAPRLPIPNDLADDIDAYRARPEIRTALASSKTLLPIVLGTVGRGRHGGTTLRVVAPNASQAKAAAQSWVARKGIISPRTGEPLHINLRRLRHTGATHLAMQGYPLDLIQDVLEHESEDSARYYIDAVGAEFLPAFEKADRNLGGRFSMMRDSWFNGRIIDSREAPDRPIVVPINFAPSAVGACGKSGACPVHPLFSCYSCEHFLAFRDADHAKVLDYVEAEYQRWRNVEVSNLRSKAIKDFDRIAVGVREVIGLIELEGFDAES
jgi:integrase